MRPEAPAWERSTFFQLLNGALPTRMSNSKRNPVSIILILGSLCVVTPFAIDMYLPAFSHIAAEFHTSTSAISLSLSTYFVGFALGQIIYGPTSDRFGRRPTFMLYLCAAACAVPLLAAARQPVLILLFASIAAFFGTGFFTGSAIIGSELFPTQARATALGISYNVARGLSALAPLTIGALSERHGLSWAFGASAIAFAAAALFAWFLPETQGASL